MRKKWSQRKLNLNALVRRKQQSKGSTDQLDNIICPECKKMYLEGENWIACDLCDRWYDSLCADLTDNQWADVDNFDWYCVECQVRIYFLSLHKVA